MRTIHPNWADRFTFLTLGISSRDPSWPQAATMDHSETGHDNRRRLFRELNLGLTKLFTVSQQHGDTVIDADIQPVKSSGDAIIALKSDAILAVGVADCPAVLLYDPSTGARAAIHSGWRGTTKNIVGKTVTELVRNYGVNPQDLLAWISPAAQQNSYEVEADVAGLFDEKYLHRKDDIKSLLDVSGAVYDQLLASGLQAEKIERNQRDTITDTMLHSYRRGGEDYGLMLALIG